MQNTHPAQNNVDMSEVEKFNQLATEWWDTDGAFATLHQINPLRVSYIQRFTELHNLRVLDVGCGGGILCEALCDLGANVTGIDLAPDSLRVAEQHAKNNRLAIHYQNISAEALVESTPGAFDVVICMEMLEHVPTPSKIIRACAQLVKPSGHLFFSTLNRHPRSFLEAIVGAEYLLGLLPKGTHDFSQFIRPSELCRWARSAKICIDDVAGLRFNPATRQYKLSKNIQVNYLCHGQPVT